MLPNDLKLLLGGEIDHRAVVGVGAFGENDDDSELIVVGGKGSEMPDSRLQLYKCVSGNEECLGMICNHRAARCGSNVDYHVVIEREDKLLGGGVVLLLSDDHGVGLSDHQRGKGEPAAAGGGHAVGVELVDSSAEREAVGICHIVEFAEGRKGIAAQGLYFYLLHDKSPFLVM